MTTSLQDAVAQLTQQIQSQSAANIDNAAQVFAATIFPLDSLRQVVYKPGATYNNLLDLLQDLVAQAKAANVAVAQQQAINLALSAVQQLLVQRQQGK